MADQPETVQLELKSGTVTIELLPQLAPNHVQRIKELARDGFYNGLTFHRVIPGFMAQTGCPTGTGTGKSSKPNLRAEFSREPHVRGVCSMARSNDPNSANSQFFICLADASWLDGQYTVWGRVIAGMEHVDAIKQGSSANNGAVSDPDRIIQMTLP
jgi:peptidylprolyl isomerase